MLCSTQVLPFAGKRECASICRLTPGDGRPLGSVVYFPHCPTSNDPSWLPAPADAEIRGQEVASDSGNLSRRDRFFFAHEAPTTNVSQRGRDDAITKGYDLTQPEAPGGQATSGTTNLGLDAELG